MENTSDEELIEQIGRSVPQKSIDFVKNINEMAKRQLPILIRKCFLLRLAHITILILEEVFLLEYQEEYGLGCVLQIARFNCCFVKFKIQNV